MTCKRNTQSPLRRVPAVPNGAVQVVVKTAGPFLYELTVDLPAGSAGKARCVEAALLLGPCGYG